MTHWSRRVPALQNAMQTGSADAIFAESLTMPGFASDDLSR